MPKAEADYLEKRSDSYSDSCYSYPAMTVFYVALCVLVDNDSTTVNLLMIFCISKSTCQTWSLLIVKVIWKMVFRVFCCHFRKKIRFSKLSEIFVWVNNKGSWVGTNSCVYITVCNKVYVNRRTYSSQIYAFLAIDIKSS